MAPEGLPKSAQAYKDTFAVIMNRLAVADAKRNNLIESITTSSSRSQPRKTQEELDAEDASLFRNEPPHLGVGAPIPEHFLISETQRGNKALRAKLFTSKGLQASKARDAEEKAASAKRGMKVESSDEEEGRSSLGRAKKLKIQRKIEPVKQPKKRASSDSSSEEQGRSQLGISKKRRIETGDKEAAKEFGQDGLPKKNNQEDEIRQEGGSSDLKGPKEQIVTKINKALVGANREAENDAKNSTEQEKAKPAKHVIGLLGEENRGMQILERKPEMDSKERKRLKKKEKKRRRKLKEQELAAKAT